MGSKKAPPCKTSLDDLVAQEQATCQCKLDLAVAKVQAEASKIKSKAEIKGKELEYKMFKMQYAIKNVEAGVAKAVAQGHLGLGMVGMMWQGQAAGVKDIA